MSDQRNRGKNARRERERIVSLLPSATEWLCALGWGDRLVGVSHQCDFPDEVAMLPRVTCSKIDGDAASGVIDAAVAEHSSTKSSLYDLDVDLVAELEPDLILTQTLCNVCAVSESDVLRSVARLPTDCLVVDLRGQTFVDVIADAHTMIDVIGQSEKAAKLIDRMESRIASVRRHSRTVKGEPPRVSLLEWIDPLYCAGHWTPELIQWAGAIDPIGRVGAPSRQIQAAELLAADPDLLLIAGCGLGADRVRDEFAASCGQGGLDGLRCVGNGDVHFFDGSAWFNRPGPRLIDALEEVSGLVAAWRRLHAPCSDVR